MTDVDTSMDELPLEHVVRVAASATLREVAGLMEDAGVSCVLVGVRPLAVVTEHDLAGALAAGLSAVSPVSQVATRSPVYATGRTTVLEATALMIDRGIRHLVVVDELGEPRGVLPLLTATRCLLDASVPLRLWSWR